ncbi:MAG: class I SAM-dependent methyltransferase [Mesorhizobium sp.]|nr:class I SAM-dependent methyltransferase [Mesorhizobium sp.]MBN9245011.1 class I SAM-dependent methyltransferase [Mesorhizobium sp.]
MDWDERYNRADYLFGTKPNEFLVSQAFRLEGGMRVLAVADGEGRNGVWLAEQALEVVAVDASSVGLQKSRELAAKRGVMLTTVKADLAVWEWEAERYDVVIAIFIQFAAPMLRDRMFEGFYTALKPGGSLIMQGYRVEQLRYGTGGPPDAKQLYTSELLLSAFAHWEICYLKEHDGPVDEGAGHSGMSALIDLVARKPIASSGRMG